MKKEDQVTTLPSISSSFSLFVVESESKTNSSSLPERHSASEQVPNVRREFDRKKCQSLPGGMKCDFPWRKLETNDKCYLEDEHVKYHASRVDRKIFKIRPHLYGYECYMEAKHLQRCIFEKINSNEIVLLDPLYTKEMLQKHQARLLEADNRKEAMRSLKSVSLQYEEAKVPHFIVKNGASRPMFCRMQSSSQKFSTTVPLSQIAFQESLKSDKMEKSDEDLVTFPCASEILPYDLESLVLQTEHDHVNDNVKGHVEDGKVIKKDSRKREDEFERLKINVTDIETKLKHKGKEVSKSMRKKEKSDGHIEISEKDRFMDMREVKKRFILDVESFTTTDDFFDGERNYFNSAFIGEDYNIARIVPLEQTNNFNKEKGNHL